MPADCLPWLFDLARKGFTEGTHRTCTPSETLERVRPQFGAIGITRLADVTGLDRIGIPVVMACRPNSRSLATSQGKGLTLEAARASAAMECIELHHAERIARPLLLGSLTEVAEAHRVADVARLPRCRRSRWGEQRQVLWIEAFELNRGRGEWLPFEVVHASAALPQPTGSGCFQSTSNGLASGNHPLEALAHGLFEVIERDAVAVWQALPRQQRGRTEVDLGTVEQAGCASVLERFTEAGVEARTWEATSDVGVPAYLAEISDLVLAGRRRFTGMGCHVDPSVALLRALTEAAQSRLTYVAGARDDIFRADYERTVAPAAGGELPRPRAPRRFDPAPPAEFGDFATELRWLLERLTAAGLEAVHVVDLTSGRFGIPVLRVVVPGLEGPDDDPSYVAGRRAREAAARGREDAREALAA